MLFFKKASRHWMLFCFLAILLNFYAAIFLINPTFRTLWVEKIAILDGFAGQAQDLGVNRAQIE